MKNLLEESAKNGSPSIILLAQIALFTATLFVRKTRLYAEHDSTGIKTELSYQIISAVLISNSSRLSGFGFIHGTCSSKVNSIANLICLILAIVFEKFYEKSLSSLCFALSITVLFLILLVIIRPSTDLGLFGFLIGIIGSVAYNLFGLKFQTWIVVAICFPLLGFRCWLDKNWLEGKKEENQSLHTGRSTGGKNQISKSKIIEAVTVAGFHLFWVYNLYRTNCLKIKGPPESISCTSSSIMGMLACVLIFTLWFGLALIPRVSSLFQTIPARTLRMGMLETGRGKKEDRSADRATAFDTLEAGNTKGDMLKGRNTPGTSAYHSNPHEVLLRQHPHMRKFLQRQSATSQFKAESRNIL